MSKNHSNASLLEVKNLTMRFGGLLAVDQINFEIANAEIFAIIGPNGAGKTTVFNCISGFYKPSAGEILMQGKNIAGLPSHKIAQRGLVRTFQNVRLFKELTALENLLVAQHEQIKRGFIRGLLNTPSYRRSENEAVERGVWWLKFMGIEQYANRLAGGLAYGHQRRLEIARSMISKPKLLLLDEPAAGLNPQEKIELQHLIKKLRHDFDVTVLLIEHDMKLVMEISERILVMEQGLPILNG